jgi:hypothetical protein
MSMWTTTFIASGRLLLYETPEKGRSRTQALHCADWLQDKLTMSLGQLLAHHLDVWRDSYYSALFWVILNDRNPGELDDDPEEHELWFGYRSDLRHAGIRDAEEAIRVSPSVMRAFEKGCDLASSGRGYAEPTSRQSRLKKLA